jgi:CTP:molybdopterin cytidylyltransferase MocA
MSSELAAVDVVLPGDVQLLLLDDQDLLAELVDEALERVLDELVDVVRGTAGPVELQVVRLARPVVVVAQQVRRGMGTFACTISWNSISRAVRPLPSPKGWIQAMYRWAMTALRMATG